MKYWTPFADIQIQGNGPCSLDIWLKLRCYIQLEIEWIELLSTTLIQIVTRTMLLWWSWTLRSRWHVRPSWTLSIVVRWHNHIIFCMNFSFNTVSFFQLTSGQCVCPMRACTSLPQETVMSQDGGLCVVEVWNFFLQKQTCVGNVLPKIRSLHVSLISSFQLHFFLENKIKEYSQKLFSKWSFCV